LTVTCAKGTHAMATEIHEIEATDREMLDFEQAFGDVALGVSVPRQAV